MKIQSILIAISFMTAAGAATADESKQTTFDGRAHWYGGSFHGKRTASGQVFDKNKLTAAHPSLPFGTKVRVMSLYSHKDVIVVVNDRCPKLSQRCIDVSEGAARELGIYPYAPSSVHCEVVGKPLLARRTANRHGVI